MGCEFRDDRCCRDFDDDWRGNGRDDECERRRRCECFRRGFRRGMCRNRGCGLCGLGCGFFF
ncbi:MAG: hypothetical protein FWH02_07220 [Oscillospiraceae bacterium]|nr:hypothetical protein [Oscillospiraceae bacterium]